MNDSPAFVTGATGWLGLRLVRKLIEGQPDRPIHCFVHRGEDASKLSSIASSIQIVEGDLRESESVDSFLSAAKGGTVFHVAGIIHPKRFVREFYEVNEEGTRRVVEAAKTSGVRRLIYVSSNSPIGCNPNAEHTFDEDSPYHPYMNYGRSKQRAEEIVNAASGDLETVILRMPWFYGPDQPARQSLFFSMIKDGKAPVLGDGNYMRSMGFVDNLCQGLMLSEQVEDAKGQTYWIADRRPYPFHEVVDTIERLLETEFGYTVAHKRLRLPAFVGNVAQLVDSIIQGAGLYHQKFHVLSEMNKHIACSIGKAERELGYNPKIELEEGMRRSLQWMADQGITL